VGCANSIPAANELILVILDVRTVVAQPTAFAPKRRA
jgi:hypothetical protein